MEVRTSEAAQMSRTALAPLAKTMGPVIGAAVLPAIDVVTEQSPLTVRVVLCRQPGTLTLVAAAIALSVHQC